VRGGSKEAGGHVEKGFMASRDAKTRKGCWRAVNLAFEKGRALRAELRREPRQPTAFEQSCMNITNSAIRVYQALLRMEERFRGNVVPSYEMIAEWAHVSRATVARALNALTEIGLLARLRRFIHTVTAEGARSEPTSNAYRVDLPRMLLELLERRQRPAPVPDDEAQRLQDRLENEAWMLAQLPRDEYLRETTSDKALAGALVSLWNSICAKDGLPA
jgi:AraC-like DNA-binding protein